jgi:ABC-type transport system involved in multi-copper enzyme maturation permease subunit
MPLFDKDLRHYAFDVLLLVFFQLATIFSLVLQLSQPSAALILSLAFGISLVGGFVFSFRTVASEESSRSMAFLLALPLTPSHIVNHKFLLNLFLTTLNFVLVFGCMLIYCVWQIGLDTLSASTLLTLWLVQLLNNHLFLCCSLLLSSSKAIWLPFPLLIIAINVAANWSSIQQSFSAFSMPEQLYQLLLLVVVWSFYALSRMGYAKSIARRGWSS